MQIYYIVKSGMNIFDVSRAYGLGFILEKLSDGDIKVEDKDYYFEIMVEGDIDIKRSHQLISLISNDQWNIVTCTLLNEKDKERIKESVSDILKNNEKIREMLSKYRNFDQNIFASVLDLDRKEKKRSALLSLDPVFVKGFRSIKLNSKYDEGENIKIAIEDIILSIIGHLNSTIYLRDKDMDIIGIIPLCSGDGIYVDCLKDIKRHINEKVKKSLHVGGTFVTVVYCSIKLQKFLIENKDRDYIVHSNISSLIFYSMRRTGKNYKSGASGIFEISSLENVPYNILEIWDDMLIKINEAYSTKKHDFRDVSICLAEFIENKTLDNYLRFISSTIRMSLKCISNKNLRSYAPDKFEYESFRRWLENDTIV